MMGKQLLISMIFISFIIPSPARKKQKDFPRHEGPYLGQKPPGMIPEIFAPGMVSSEKYQEFGSVFSPDGNEFYFTRELSPEKWIIMVTKKENNTWTTPRAASFSGTYMDLEMSVSPDGQRLYFCSNRPIETGSKPEKDFDIWFVKRRDTDWTAPVHAGLGINSNRHEWHPSVSQKGTLYFCGGDPPGLYKSDGSDTGRYHNRVMIGDLRTTDVLGGHPYIAPDESYLITSAINGNDNRGNWDLYVSFRNADGNWTKSKNLGRNINTGASEDFPSVTADGKYLFFTRLIKDGRGNDMVDIYWVDAAVIQELKPRELK